METTITPCSFAPVFPYNPEKKRKQPQLPQSPEGFPQLKEGWLAEFETFRSADGQEDLFGQLFRPQRWKGETAHRAIVVLHGQGEHCGRYVHWPFYVGNLVSSVYSYDHRGHGRSSGNRGHVDSFDLYADDAALAINRYYEYLLEKFGQGEIHLVGHSMGGQIALRCLLNHSDLPVQSVTLSSPMFHLAFDVPRVKEMAGRFLRRVAPTLKMPGEPLDELISSDPRVCLHYKNDPLNHGFVSPAFYFSSMEAKDDTLRRASKLNIPMLVQVGMEDRIINPESIIEFYENLTQKDRKLLRYPDLYHEVYNEPEREKVFTELCSWIDQHSEKTEQNSTLSH
jgi:alpha-beta hydrolase superfamily lysophospholipase